MADLAFEHELAELSAGPDSPHADGVVDGGIPSVDGRFHVLPHEPLPALSTPSAQAFRAVDGNNPSQASYALITDPLIPFRPTAMTNARELAEFSVVEPVTWGSIDWPQTGRRETLLLLRRPSGDPLMSSIDAVTRPLLVPEIARDLMKPMIELLAMLADHRLAHRNIRPTNLFRAGSDGPIIAGEFYSAPPGFNQPSVFEPIERAMCPPAGRGLGEITDDLFALGVTTLFLALGRNPVAHLDDKTLLALRVEMGSYAALTKDEKPTGDLSPVIRSLMHDNPLDRWSLEDLVRWADLGVANQAKPATMVRSDRGFEFAEGHFHTRRQLALAFSQNWQAARATVLTDEVERWAERSIKDRDLAQQIVDCRHSGSDGPRMVSDDLLLARTIITLDPDGPLCFRDLNMMPDGLGATAALVAPDMQLAATFTEVITSKLMEFWLEKQVRPGSLVTAGKEDAKKILAFLEKTGPGFGIERCVYEMNKGIACQSPRFKDVNAVQVRELMEALDVGARKGEQQIDRHVAAFLGARYSGTIDSELSEFVRARSGEDALAGQLKIFAAVQLKHGPPELPNLATLFLSHLDILLSPYQNVALRQRLRRDAERTALTGRLPELLGIIRNRKLLNADKKGFDLARRHYRSLVQQVHAQEVSRERLAPRSLVVGRKAAAYVSSGIAATVVVMIVLAGAA